MTNDTPVESSYALLLKSAKKCKFAKIEIFVENAKNEIQNYEHFDLNHKILIILNEIKKILIEIVNILNEDMNILNEIKKMFIKIVNILNKIIKF